MIKSRFLIENKGSDRLSRELIFTSYDKRLMKFQLSSPYFFVKRLFYSLIILPIFLVCQEEDDLKKYTGAASWLTNTAGCNSKLKQPDDIPFDLDDESKIIEDLVIPLVLDIPAAINIAIGANRNLANSLDNVKQSQLSLELALSAFDVKITPSFDVGCIGGGNAGFGATVGGSLELCKKFSYGTRASVRPYITKDAHHYHSGVQAMIAQPLLRGFGKEFTLAPVYAAQFANRTAFRSAYSAGVDMVTRLIQAMYTVARTEEMLKLEMEAYERLKRFYTAIKVKEKIGMADSLDVYRTETEMKHAEDSIDNEKEAFEDAKDRVRELLALPLGKNITIVLEQDYSPLDPDVDQAIEAALANRIEIEQSLDRWKDTGRLTRIAENHLMPQLDLVLDFSNIGRDEIFTNSFTNERDSRWGVGFMTSTDWNKTAQQVAYQQSLFTKLTAERNYEQTQNIVIMEVKRAIRVLRRAGQKIELQKKQIHSSEGGLKLAKLKFDRGLANNFDVIQAEKTLRQALSSHLSAIIEHKIGEYRFLAAIGLLVDKPKICP